MFCLPHTELQTFSRLAVRHFVFAVLDVFNFQVAYSRFLFSDVGGLLNTLAVLAILLA